MPKNEIVQALAYLTIPALVGPVVGPPLGGFITTYFDWRWIFFINIPIGVLGIVLATLFIPRHPRAETPAARRRRLPAVGVGLAALMLGLRDRWAGISCRSSVSVACVVVGALASSLYVLPRAAHAASGARARAAAHPDLPGERDRRLAVPHRRRRDPVPAAADAADRLRPEPAAVRAPHLRRGGRRAVHEDAGGAHPAGLRLPRAC